jgi:hypothetical protein
LAGVAEGGAELQVGLAEAFKVAVGAGEFTGATDNELRVADAGEAALRHGDGRARKYEQALDQSQKYTEIAPQSSVPHDEMARIYWMEGNAREAISEERKAAALEHFPERMRKHG